MYFAETGGEPVLDYIPNYLCKLVNDKVISNANNGIRFVLGEIRKNNLYGSRTDYYGLNLKWKSDDALCTNSTIKIWTEGTSEPSPMNLITMK